MTSDRIQTILNENKNINSDHINQLTTVIDQLANEVTEGPIGKGWTPSPDTMQRAFKAGLPALEISSSIESFITFAKERKYVDGLNNKYLIHVNILMRS